MIASYGVPQLLYVAAKLDIADMLKRGPRNCLMLRRTIRRRMRVSVDKECLYRVMRALASVGVFKEVRLGEFANSRLSKLLMKDSPDSLRDKAIMVGTLYYEAWGALLANVCSGETAFEQLHDQAFFSYLDGHPHVSRTFDATMMRRDSTVETATLEAFRQLGHFEDARCVVDVGGGYGWFLVALLNAYPRIKHGVLLERPSVIRNALAFRRRDNAAARVRRRYTLVAGDFFKSVPSYDQATYVLRQVLHDWDDKKAARLLANCRQAMSPGARLIIVEQVIPGPRESAHSKLRDVHMMVLTGGRERTRAEFKHLLRVCGFTFDGVVNTRSWCSLILARRMR